MKTEMNMAHEGEFLREYGKQYFVVASEALNIGRIKWNMVPIGKKGQGDIAFYLTTEQMLALCTEILNGKFAKKIEADKSNKYPSAYAYMTGEDGSLHLAIGAGNVGCRVQMRNTKVQPQLNYTMAVSMEAMNTMARKYMLCAGLTPVATGSYYAGVVAEFEKGREERAKFRKQPSDAEIGDSVDAKSVLDETDETKVSEPATIPATPNVEKETDITKGVSNTEKEDGTKGASQNDGENYTLTLHGPKTVKKGFYVFEGVDDKCTNISLMFRKEDADKLSWFKKFENAAALGDTSLKICGEKKNNFILYIGPAKK
jgi:hypothetical protein